MLNDPLEVALCNGENREHSLKKGMELALGDYFKNIKGPIVIKPNLLSAKTKLASTHPYAIEAVMSYIRKWYDGKLYIAEGSHVASLVFKEYRLYDLAKKYNAECFCIDTDEENWVEFNTISLNGIMHKARVSKLVATSQLKISLTIPKTHANVGISLSLKNMVGCVHPDDRKLIHGLGPDVSKEVMNKHRRRIYDLDNKVGKITAQVRGIIINKFPKLCSKQYEDSVKEEAITINKNIVNLSQVVSPDISIIDGFIGMEGEGPWHGNPVKIGTAIVSRNFLAADIVACKLMGFDESYLGYKKFLQSENVHKINFDSIKLLGDELKGNQYSFKAHSNFNKLKHNIEN